MENTENKPLQNMVGHLYGSRISKNGKWLNVTIVATINGKDEKICVPVRLTDDGKHPYAFTELDTAGATRASLCHIPVYDGTKKAEDGLPF